MSQPLLSGPYKRFLGHVLAWGLRTNYFDYPAGGWPPPTPARKYIDEFLTTYQDQVKGRCLEFAPPIYRPKFAQRTEITSYDVWNVAPGEDVTIVGDLQSAPQIPDASFDTIICTHVLCSVAKPWLAVAEMHRLLAPDGVVLCTNPCVLQKYAPDPIDCWRFTRDSMEILFSNFSEVRVHSYGNAVTVAASPFFLMTGDLPKWVLERQDSQCPSIVAAAAWK